LHRGRLLGDIEILQKPVDTANGSLTGGGQTEADHCLIITVTFAQIFCI